MAADIDTTLPQWSTTESSNKPAGGTSVGSNLDDNLRAIQKVVRGWLATKGSDISSATTTDLGAVEGLMHDITGTTTITGFGTIASGILKVVKFEGSLTLTHNSTSLILPGGASITTADGDIGIFISEGSGNWRCVSYVKASAAPVTLSPITNSLSGDVSLSNTSSYFDGPSVAQGTAGTWFVSGTVTVSYSGSAGTIAAKLWDGTTVIASAQATSNGSTAAHFPISLSGYISAPAGNLRISVKDSVNTTSSIKANASGNSKDSTITAIRIA